MYCHCVQGEGCSVPLTKFTLLLSRGVRLHSLVRTSLILCGTGGDVRAFPSSRRSTRRNLMPITSRPVAPVRVPFSCTQACCTLNVCLFFRRDIHIFSVCYRSCVDQVLFNACDSRLHHSVAQLFDMILKRRAVKSRIVFTSGETPPSLITSSGGLFAHAKSLA